MLYMENASNFDAWFKIFHVLHESQKRWFAAQKASEIGYGGIQQVRAVAGLSRTTITQGLKELSRDQPLSAKRVRQPGGGRKNTRHTHETVVQAIEHILDETTVGDPMSSLKGTCKSTRNMADELRTQGVSISYRTVGRILQALDYSVMVSCK